MIAPPDSLPPRQHLAISWDDVQRDAILLAKALAAQGSWRGIVAVARGGLAPAALVARALGIRLIETVSVATYQGKNSPPPNC
jgi:xanthine phosphoribosyltransferase